MEEVENYLKNAKYSEGLSKGRKQTVDEEFETISSWRMAFSSTSMLKRLLKMLVWKTCVRNK